MASTISAGTTAGTALNLSGDTSGILQVQGVPIGGTGGLGTGNASIMKNRIINGAMLINQRNYNGNPTTSGTYTLDRWVFDLSQASKFSVSQNAGSVTPPVGFANYMGITSLSAYTVGAGETFRMNQYIEGFNFYDLSWGTANAKTVTLSAWVYSSLTGTFGGALTNDAGTRSYPFTYTISSANTWTQVSITIAGDTSGSWVGATNAMALRVKFSLGTGSTSSGTAGAWASADYSSATGAVSVVGTSGATFYITGVQLEVGSSATGYEYRQYGQEIALCQRYYSQLGGENSNDIISGAYNTIGGGAYLTLTLPVKMRTAPTSTKVGTWLVSNVGQPSIQATSSTTVAIVASSTATGAYYYSTNTTTGYLTNSAEL